MKLKIFTALLICTLLVSSNVNAQIQNFPAETTPVGADLLYMVKSPGGAGTDRHVTVSNLTKGLTAASGTVQGVMTTGTQTIAGVKTFSDGMVSAGNVTFQQNLALTGTLISNTISDAGTITTTGVTVNNSTSRQNDITTDLLTRRSSTDALSSSLIFRKTRNTIASPQSVAASDQVGAILFSPYDGDEFVAGAAEIRSTVDGTPGNNDTPTKIQFFTTPNNTKTPIERMQITESGTIAINRTAAPSASLHLVVHSASNVGQIIQLASTPTANAFEVNTSGGSGGDLAKISATGIVTSAGLVIPTSTPASAAATGVAGTITWDSSFIYVCVATNTWKRVAIATW